MPGTFNIANPPKRPGAYFNFRAAQAVAIPPSIGNVVAVPFTHTWGPENITMPLSSFGDFDNIYATDLTSVGYRAIKMAFQGQGIQGQAGAGRVLGYRIVGSAGALATRVLTNTNAAANALTVNALYKGTKGNTLTLTARTNAVNAALKDLAVILNGTEVESWTYNPTGGTQLATLAATINGFSDWISVSVIQDAFPLTAVTGVTMSGGNDGTTLVAGDWTNVMAAMETQRFDYFAPFDMTDGPITASLAAWAILQNSRGKRFFLLIGGALNEVISTAVTRAGTLNNPDICTIGVGSILDASLLDQNGLPVTMSTSLFVPRLAGIMSSLGENRSLSGARIFGATLLNGATESAIDQAFDNGIIVLSTDSNAEAPVHIEKGLTTWVTTTTVDLPYKLFRVPKYVRTLHDLQMELTDYVNSNVVGKLQINSKTRSAVVAEVSARLKLREDLGAIQPGWSVAVSMNPPPSDSDEFVALSIALAFGRSAEQVLTTMTVS